MNAPAHFLLSRHHTAIRCLFVLALQRGVQLKPEALAGISEEDPAGSILRVLAASGLEGRLVEGRRFKHLAGLSGGLPVMALQKGGNWVLVVEARDLDSVVVRLRDREGGRVVRSGTGVRGGLVLRDRCQGRPRRERRGRRERD